MATLAALALALLQADTLQARTVLRVQAPMRDLAVDASGKYLVTLSEDGYRAAWKRDDDHEEVWSMLDPARASRAWSRSNRARAPSRAARRRAT